MSDRYGRIIGKVKRHSTIWSIRSTDVSNLWKITKTHNYKPKTATFIVWNIASIDKAIDFIYNELQMNPSKMTKITDYDYLSGLKSDCVDKNIWTSLLEKTNQSILFLKSLGKEELMQLIQNPRWTDILCIFGIIEGYGLICGKTKKDVIQEVENVILETDCNYLKILSKESNLLNTLLIKTNNDTSTYAITIFEKDVYINESHMW